MWWLSWLCKELLSSSFGKGSGNFSSDSLVRLDMRVYSDKTMFAQRRCVPLSIALGFRLHASLFTSNFIIWYFNWAYEAFMTKNIFLPCQKRVSASLSNCQNEVFSGLCHKNVILRPFQFLFMINPACVWFHFSTKLIRSRRAFFSKVGAKGGRWGCNDKVLLSWREKS